MGSHGKLVAIFEFKAGGDVFYKLFRYKPQHLTTVSPEKVLACDLQEGEFGHIGCIMSWTYNLDGKGRRVKNVIQSIDEEKKLLQFKVLEGDFTELYKDFVTTFQVETNEGIAVVTCTLEYEMRNEKVGHPISMLSFFINLIKDVDTHLVKS